MVRSELTKQASQMLIRYREMEEIQTHGGEEACYRKLHVVCDIRERCLPQYYGSDRSGEQRGGRL